MAEAYHSPTDLAEALDLLKAGPAAVIAGGTDLYPGLGRGALRGEVLDLTRIAALRGIAGEEGGLRIGAATTWTEIARADLPPACHGLQQAARQVGGIQIQNAATVGGNLCNASPAADGVPPLLTLEAEVELAGPDGQRRLPLARFLRGPRRTALAPGEILTALHLPAPPTGSAGAFEKLGARTYLVISIAMVAALVALDAEGRIAEARVAVGACSPVAQRLPALEADLVGRRPDAIAVTGDHLAPLSPISDVRADAVYRREAVPHLIRRAILRAADG